MYYDIHVFSETYYIKIEFRKKITKQKSTICNINIIVTRFVYAIMLKIYNIILQVLTYFRVCCRVSGGSTRHACWYPMYWSLPLMFSMKCQGPPSNGDSLSGRQCKLQGVTCDTHTARVLYRTWYMCITCGIYIYFP